MSRAIPRNRIPVVAAWLAARGHDLLTAPAGLVQIALEEPGPTYTEPEFGDLPPAGPDEDDDRVRCWF